MSFFEPAFFATELFHMAAHPAIWRAAYSTSETFSNCGIVRLTLRALPTEGRSLFDWEFRPANPRLTASRRLVAEPRFEVLSEAEQYALIDPRRARAIPRCVPATCEFRPAPAGRGAGHGHRHQPDPVRPRRGRPTQVIGHARP
jgi:hypothetical protein